MTISAFMASKKQAFSTRERKQIAVKPNGRSADFIMPSFAIGCDLGCSYCHIARHRPFGNPVELFTNAQAIWEVTRTHWQSLPVKTEPTQCDPTFWTYDIGEGTDCLAPSTAETARWFIQRFLHETSAKPSFATKIPQAKELDPLPENFTNRARVRVSLMPQETASLVEVGTMAISKRIQAIDAILALGYEVHINFSPVIAHPGWVAAYTELFQEIDATISPAAKAQLKCEVIFLTHHPKLHALNLEWHPEAEQLLWTPQWQETKTNQRGDTNVLRYKQKIKKVLVEKFKEILENNLPYCKIRYIF